MLCNRYVNVYPRISYQSASACLNSSVSQSDLSTSLTVQEQLGQFMLSKFYCRFLVDYMLAADEGQPVILHGVMSAWPALSKWQDLEYLSQVAGPRTVPVEMGKHYLHEGWGQQLMLFSTFIKLHVLQEAAQHPQQPSSCAAPGARAAEQLDTSSACAACESLSEGSSDVQPAPAGSPTEQQQQHQLGYLAQHPLFDQIPALKMDIMEPEYCSLGEGEMQSINAWFGPADTVREQSAGGSCVACCCCWWKTSMPA